MNLSVHITQESHNARRGLSLIVLRHPKQLGRGKIVERVNSMSSSQYHSWLRARGPGDFHDNFRNLAIGEAITIVQPKQIRFVGGSRAGDGIELATFSLGT